MYKIEQNVVFETRLQVMVMVLYIYYDIDQPLKELRIWLKRNYVDHSILL